MAGTVVGSDLLDEGLWAITESLRVHRRSQRLADATRELALKYLSRRLPSISGGSVRVDGLTTLRSLLQSAPGEALCDACLAFACATSLVEMREMTEVLLQTEPQFQRVSSCASCRRIVPAIIYK